MSIIAMKSQCISRIRADVVNKSDLVLSDYKTRFRSSQRFLSGECYFSCRKLVFQKKFKSVMNRNLVENQSLLEDVKSSLPEADHTY